MSSLSVLRSECNSKIKINFHGGDLSSDAGLLLIKEFICKIGLDNLIFQTDDKIFRIHKDAQNLSAVGRLFY